MGATRASLCEVNLRPSRYHLVIVALGHCAAFIALWLASLWLLVKFTLSIFLLIHLRQYYLRFIVHRHCLSIRSLRLLDDQWRVWVDGQWFRAWPKGEVVVTAPLICFQLSVEGKHRPVYLILFPDSADPMELHAFRLRLLLESPALFGGEGMGSRGSE